MLATSTVVVTFAITVSGPGVTITAIDDPEVIFPLRLGFACRLGISLSTVLVVNISNVTSGTVAFHRDIQPNDAVNTRTADCPSSISGRSNSNISSASKRILALSSRFLIDSLKGSVVPRAAYVATSGVAHDGSLVVVTLVVRVAVSSAELAACGGNLSAIVAVAPVVSHLVDLLEEAPTNSSRSSQPDAIAYGGFLSAAALAIGTNVSALLIGSVGGPLLSATSAVGYVDPHRGAPEGVGAVVPVGAVIGIALALALLLGALLVALLLCWKRRARNRKRKALGVAQTGPPDGLQLLVTNSNPMLSDRDPVHPDARSLRSSAPSSAPATLDPRRPHTLHARNPLRPAPPTAMRSSGTAGGRAVSNPPASTFVAEASSGYSPLNITDPASRAVFYANPMQRMLSSAVACSAPSTAGDAIGAERALAAPNESSAAAAASVAAAQPGADLLLARSVTPTVSPIHASDGTFLPQLSDKAPASHSSSDGSAGALATDATDAPPTQPSASAGLQPWRDNPLRRSASRSLTGC